MIIFGVSSTIDDQVDQFFDRPIARKAVGLLRDVKDTFFSAASSLWSVVNQAVALVA